jgi:toxin ParE1/3/4
VDSIWARIAVDNTKAAEELLDRFAAVFEMLAQNPQAGRARPDLGLDLRSFTVENFIIFYIPQSNGIAIVRVIHGRQDIRPADMT